MDYTILASHWLEDDCSDPNWCGKADIDTDGDVDADDLMGFAGYSLSAATVSNELDPINRIPPTIIINIFFKQFIFILLLVYGLIFRINY